MLETDLGLLEPKAIGKKKLKRSRTSMYPMDNVKGQKIHLEDNLFDEVRTRRNLLGLRLCHII